MNLSDDRDDEFGMGEIEPRAALLDCSECRREFHGPAYLVTTTDVQCEQCHAASGGPGACFQCGKPMGWSNDGLAECNGKGGCDAVYPLETVRTYRLGQLVERLVKESVSGSAEEVGRMILAAGRTSLRRVQ